MSVSSASRIPKPSGVARQFFSATPKRISAPRAAATVSCASIARSGIQHAAVRLEYAHFSLVHLQSRVARFDFRFAQDLNPQVVLPRRAM